MQGTGTLFVYDYAALLTGSGSLTVGPNEQLASVTLTSSGLLYAYGESNYVSATLPPLAAQGWETGASTAYAVATFPALTGWAEGGVYVPPELEYVYAEFPPLVASAHMVSSSSGSVDAAFPAFLGKGGEGDYGEINATLPALSGTASDDLTPGLAMAVSTVLTFDAAQAVQEHIVVFDEHLRVVDTITASRQVIAQILEQINASSEYTLLGSYLASADASLLAASSATGTIYFVQSGSTITRPGVDPEARTWATNLETGASSQYDGYGFNSYFEMEGAYYGVADDGIYLLDGATDNGVTIEALVDFGLSDCGVLGRKKILNIHVGITDGTRTYLRVTTDSGEHTYRLERCQRGSTGWRAKLPQNVQGTDWRFVLIAKNDFELTGIEFMPAKLSRRL